MTQTLEGAPEYGVGSDGNYFVVGDLVRHNSDDLAIRNGEMPGPPGRVESLSLRYAAGSSPVRIKIDVWAKVRWPKNEKPWPSPPGGGSIESRANDFRKITREEQMAERFMV
jgi:hypothetical protein